MMDQENKIPLKINQFKEDEEMKLCIQRIGNMFSKLWQKLKTIMQSIARTIVGFLKSLKLDKWQYEKEVIPNNKRKRKGMPMVRRQAHLKNIQNIRKSKTRRKILEKYHTK